MIWLRPRFPAALLGVLAVLLVLSSGCEYINRYTKRAEPQHEAPTTIVDTKGTEVKIPGKLVFVRDGNLWQLENGAVTQLTKGGKDLQPSWSPDGTTIAYVKREQDYSDILLFVAATGDYKPLTNNKASKSVWVFRPAWSPDGKQIAYVSDQYSWDTGLHIMNANGTGARRVSQSEGAGGADSPTWAPDGKTIALAAFRSGNQQIWLFNLTTSRWTQVTNSVDGAYDPRWSPVDDTIAYAARSDKSTDIWITSIDGKNQHQLTHDGAARAPAWSPDGKLLAYIAEHNGSFDIWVAPVDRVDGEIALGTPVRLTNGLQVDAASGVAWLYES